MEERLAAAGERGCFLDVFVERYLRIQGFSEGVEAGSCRVVGTEARPLEIFGERVFFFIKGQRLFGGAAWRA